MLTTGTDVAGPKTLTADGTRLKTGLFHRSAASVPGSEFAQTVTAADAARAKVGLYHSIKRPVRPVSTVELVRLYNLIEKSLDYKAGGVVQLVTPTAQEQCAETAYALAWAGASVLGKRVLFVDLTGHSTSSLELAAYTAVSKAKSEIESAPELTDQIRTQERGVFVASLTYDHPGSDIVFSSQFQNFVHELRSFFDLVVIATPPAVDNAIASAVSGFVDGSILILEANRTRYRHAARALDLLSSSRAPVLGVVLAKRVAHMPRWLRRFFWD